MTAPEKSFLDAIKESVYDPNNFTADLLAFFEKEFPPKITEIVNKIKGDISGKAKNGQYKALDNGKKYIDGVYWHSHIFEKHKYSKAYFSCSFYFTLPKQLDSIVNDTLMKKLSGVEHEFNYSFAAEKLCFSLTPLVEKTVVEVKKRRQKTVYEKGFLFFKKKKQVTEEVIEREPSYKITAVGYTKKILEEIKRRLEAEGVSVVFIWNGEAFDGNLTIPHEKIVGKLKKCCEEYFNNERLGNSANSLINIKYSIVF